MQHVVPGGGGGYSDICFHTYVGSGHLLGVQHFEFQYFGGFSEKMNICLEYEDFVDIFFFLGGGGGGGGYH